MTVARKNGSSVGSSLRQPSITVPMFLVTLSNLNSLSTSCSTKNGCKCLFHVLRLRLQQWIPTSWRCFNFSARFLSALRKLNCVLRNEKDSSCDNGEERLEAFPLLQIHREHTPQIEATIDRSIWLPLLRLTPPTEGFPNGGLPLGRSPQMFPSMSTDGKGTK